MKRLALLVLTCFCCSACGEDVEVAKNYCEKEDCNSLGTCVQGADGPVCLCYEWALRDKNSCVKKTQVCDSEAIKCGSHGTCWEQDGNARCFCDEGYETKNNTCVAIVDACEGVSCGDHGVCVDASGHAVCVCNKGYTTGADGKCVKGKNPCDGVTCEHGVCAVTGDNQAACVCESGYVFVTDGGQPQCIEETDVCSGVNCGVGVCAVTHDGEATCICPDGYQISADGRTCEASTTDCSNVDCSGHGVCLLTDGGSATDGSRTISAACVCETNYKPTYKVDASGVSKPDCVAEIEGNACNVGLVDCSGHGSCVEAVNVTDAGVYETARCICDEGYHPQGETACVADEHPCLGVDCSNHGVCVERASADSNEKKAACLCDEGYVASGMECLALTGNVVPQSVPATKRMIGIHPEADQKYVRARLLAYLGDNEGSLSLVATRVHNEGGELVAYDGLTKRCIIQFDESISDSDFLSKRAALRNMQENARPVFDVVIEDFIDEPSSLPNDPWGMEVCSGNCWAGDDGANWYLKKAKVPVAWDWSQGGTVKIGLIDFGFNAHEDLNITSDRIKALEITPSEELRAHGTAVAGLIGATGNNNSYLTGELWSPEIYVCETDGTLSRFGDCLHWLDAQGVSVINYSGNHVWNVDAILNERDKPWNVAEVEVSIGFEAAALQKELIASSSKLNFVFSAGNEALEAEHLRYAVPAAAISNSNLRQRVIIVGAAKSTECASETSECVTDYSNRGADVLFFGGDGESSSLVSNRNLTVLDSENGIVGGYYGTSYAAALVTGAVGMMRSVRDTSSAEDVKSLLQEASDKSGINVAQAMLLAIQRFCYVNLTENTHYNADLRPINVGNKFDVIHGTCGCTPQCSGSVCGAPDGCSGLCTGPELRSCNGSILSYCALSSAGNSASMQTRDCGEISMACGWSSDSKMWDCVSNVASVSASEASAEAAE